MSRPVGILALAACAVQATAFLLPPNIAQAVEDEGATGSGLQGFSSPFNTVVQLPCSECAFSRAQSTEKIEQNEEEPFFWIQGGANSVLANFTVSEDGQRLEVNGETIYPLDLLEASIFASPKVYVDQIRSGASLAEVEAGTEKATPLEVTGHSISIRQQGDDFLIPIEYQIFEVEGQTVSLDAITVKVLDLAGSLTIVTVEVERSELSRPEIFGPPSKDWFDKDFSLPLPQPEFGKSEVDAPDFSRQKECNMLPAALCKLRNTVEAKLMAMGRKGGCHGRIGGRPHDGGLPTHVRPHFGQDANEHEELHDRPHHGHGRPHHMRPHHHHRHHRHHFMRAFTRGLAAVLIPTLAGVAAGMTVSLVGLVVGRLISFLWIKLYRGGRRGYASVAPHETAADGLDIEKEAVEEEPLPAYEEIVRETN